MQTTCGGAQPRHLTTLHVYGRNGLGERSLRTAEFLLLGEQPAPESCFRCTGSRANQEMQDESIFKNKTKKKCLHRSNAEFHREIQISA